MSAYAISDLHGNFNLATQILEFLKPDDTLFFLGDANDRGPDGWKIIKLLLSDKRVKYIKGNHEQFIIDFYNQEDIDIWFYNGGVPTYEAILKDPSFFDYENKIKNLPTKLIYHNINNQKILLCHAGSLIKDFETSSSTKLIWDRYHKKIFEDSLDINTILIHGHTPSANAPNLYNGPYFSKYIIKNKYKEHGFIIPYIDNTIRNNLGCAFNRIDIDCHTYSTHKICLLNLDTFEYQFFYDSEKLKIDV